MGLDMYLYRFPRIKNYGPNELMTANEYFDWQESDRAKGSSFEAWTGCDEDSLPDKETMAILKEMRSTRYWEWDYEHRYPHNRFYDQVAYWRKTNAVHKWFVDHVQDGEDDCAWHNEVTKEVLEELRDICKEILEKCVLVIGKVKNGYTIGPRGGRQWHYEEGKIVSNPWVCKKLLPCTDGFFFGNMEYNEYYMDDVKYTFEVLNKILEETDFDTEMIYYSSSW